MVAHGQGQHRLDFDIYLLRLRRNTHMKGLVAILESKVAFYQKDQTCSRKPVITQCVKGGGAKKMLQTAKTFVTKLVRYIEWIVDPLCGHQFSLIWYCYGQKRPFFWPKLLFLAIRGSRRPRWLAKVDQMVDHS